MSAIAAPFIPWVGGKEKLVPYISQVLPPNVHQLLDPFGGGGALTLGLPTCPSRLDIYNDFNSDLVNLFVCVRDCLLALLKELDFLPLHSRAEFDDLKSLLAHAPLAPEELENWEAKELEIAASFPESEATELLAILKGKAELRNVQRAAAFYKTSRGSFSGTRSSFGVKRNNIRRFRYQLERASKRLQDVVIENKDAMSLIPERDISNGIVYCDPPYYEAEQLYEAEFGRRDHVRLFHVLKACKGYVVVSYNDCPYIRNLYKDFFIITLQRDNPMAKKKKAVYRELIITNYDPRQFWDKQLDLFEEPGTKWTMDLVHIPRKILKQ